MWETKSVPLDDRTFIWIKNKVSSTRTGQIIIQIKDNKAISIHYFSDEYYVDIDKDLKK